MDGTTADSVFVRFSGAIYNRWDYDSEQKVYYRNVDAQDDINGTNEVYVPHIDALNGTQVFTDNIVILISEYKEMDGPTITSPELIGTGTAYVARNGILIECQWIREYPNDMVKLIGDDKQPIQLKPGRTWYEVLNIGSKVSTDDKGTWRVVNYMPE